MKNLLNKQDYSKTDKLLLCLAVEAENPKEVAAIRKLAENSGLRAASKWNLSQLLSGSRGLAIRTNAGWELTEDGKKHVSQLVGPLASTPTLHLLPQLRTQLAKIPNTHAAEFIEEAIRCLELNLIRAGVVLSWVGAVAVLYDVVLNKHLPAFNAEALRRNPKWKIAKTADDLARMKEADFLEVLEGISVIGKSTKQELDARLKLRNGAGHPNHLRIGPTSAAAHVESLLLNVFAVFC